MNLDGLLRDAQIAYMRGDLRLASDLGKRALSINPIDVEATTFYGIVCARMGNREVAVTYLQNALKRDPKRIEAHVALSTLLFGLGRTEEAKAHGQAAIDLEPNRPELRIHFARDLSSHGDPDGAIQTLQAGLELMPDGPELLRDLAALYGDLGLRRPAATAWNRLLQMQPGNLMAWLKLGGIRLVDQNFTGVVECGERAVALEPNSADARLMLALGLAELGRAAEAKPHLERAIELNPNEHLAYAALGLVYQELGDFEGAAPYLRKTLELRPTHGLAYQNLLRSKKATPEDEPFLQTIESYLEHPDANGLDRSYMHYTLGKAREELGAYEASFRHYEQANRLAAQVWFGEESPDDTWYRDLVQATIETFTADRMRDLRSRGDESARPLLVLGMMRSGTTLVEQIVSSHSAVAAGGELTYWHDHALPVFDAKAGTVDEGHLREVAKGYAELLDRIGPGALRVTDKLPHNYAMLGLVLSAFPNARVIHIRRNPLDNCLSIYTTPYQKPPSFALSPKNIVSAYREYERLMAHWHRVLPPGQILDVSYEELVANPEPTTRAMIEFAALPWEDACLHPESNARPVNTPSVWQVRQPLYRTSTARWRKFEPWLGEFRALLLDAT